MPFREFDAKSVKFIELRRRAGARKNISRNWTGFADKFLQQY
jgi:hypothetical protein